MPSDRAMVSAEVGFQSAADASGNIPDGQPAITWQIANEPANSYIGSGYSVSIGDLPKDRWR